MAKTKDIIQIYYHENGGEPYRTARFYSVKRNFFGKKVLKYYNSIFLETDEDYVEFYESHKNSYEIHTAK